MTQGFTCGLIQGLTGHRRVGRQAAKVSMAHTHARAGGSRGLRAGRSLSCSAVLGVLCTAASWPVPVWLLAVGWSGHLWIRLVEGPCWAVVTVEASTACMCLLSVVCCVALPLPRRLPLHSLCDGTLRLQTCKVLLFCGIMFVSASASAGGMFCQMAVANVFVSAALQRTALTHNPPHTGHAESIVCSRRAPRCL